MTLRFPSVYYQPDLFEQGEVSYSHGDFPLFFDTLVRWQFNENLYMLCSSDMSYLLVSGYGVSLSKKSARLVIKEQNKAVHEIPFFRLKNVAILSKGVSLSSDLVEHCCKYSIALSFHDFSAKPIALLQSMYAPTHGKLKYLQLEAKTSSAGTDLGIRIIRGKISNQIALLKYVTKNISDVPENAQKLAVVAQCCAQMESCIDKCQNIKKKDEAENARVKIMGYEGIAARYYWKAWSILLADRVCFDGRDCKKMPRDGVNALLNYGYGILYAKIWSAIVLAGLDPYVGFLHADTSGQPALVFDLIEEFRAPFVDKVVVAFLMLKRSVKLDHGLLTAETRHLFSQKILERLSSSEYYEGETVQVGDIILAQARRVRAYLEGRSTFYKPFRFKW